MKAMRAVTALAVALSCLPGSAWATSCFTPPVCARLQPESVFFIGEVLPGDAEPVTLPSGGNLFRRRIRVVERLFGLDATVSEVPVLFYNESGWSGTLLLDTTRRGGDLMQHHCGVSGDASHPYILGQIQFLRQVRDEPEGTGSVRVNVWGVEGATVNLEGPVSRQASSTRGEARFDKLPPGLYRVAASHPAYERDPANPGDSVTQVVAHSCPTPRIPMLPTLQVAGITVNAHGEPVASVPLWLKSNDNAGRLFKGTSDTAGRFVFPRVHPGLYYLLTSSRERKTYFNKKSWQSEATVIEVHAGASLNDLRMELLDSGSQRTVRVHVTDHNGQPLAQTWLRDEHGSNEYSTIGAARAGDSAGMAVLPLFENAQYVINVTGKLPSGRVESVSVHVPAGKGDKDIRVKLGAGYSVE